MANAVRMIALLYGILNRFSSGGNSIIVKVLIIMQGTSSGIV
jgi:hypothetical protein